MNNPRELRARLADPRGRVAASVALCLYLAVTAFIYGQKVLADPSMIYVGTGNDPAQYIWSMVWWPYAIEHRIDPFISRVIWTPVGFNLTWAAVIPGPALILWPITRLFGPVVSFNVLMILTPTLVCWSTFLLCRRIGGHFYASLVGGYLFGFSPYMMGHVLLGQPNLTFIPGVPLSVYLMLARLERAISPPTFVVLLATLLTLQFAVSTEIIALITVFGGIALLLALLVLPRDQKIAVGRTIPEIALAYAIFGIVVSPFLYYAFAYGVPEQMHPVDKCSADLLGYFVPSPLMMFSLPFHRFANTLTPHVWYGGKGVYTSPALLAIIVLYARSRWQSGIGKLLILTSVAIVICSFGPYLHVADHRIVTFPWYWIMQLPTLNQALPVRFAMFLYLCVAIMAAIVLSDRSHRKWIRVALGVLAVLMLLPNRRYPVIVPQQVDTPAFFSADILEANVQRGDTLLIFPFSIQGTTILWQAQTKMYFNMVGGYVSGYVPEDYRQWPVVRMMLRDEVGPDFAAQLKPFLAHYRVKGIVLGPSAQEKWRAPISSLGIEPKEIGGVLFYPIPS